MIAPPENPAGWPTDVLPVFERAITVEFASLTRVGGPVTFPLTPYVSETGRTLDVSTGLTYPAKAERARRNPKVALLYADPIGSGLANPPVVLVQGIAAVRDANMQANTDRYVRLSLAKLPAAFKGMPRIILRGFVWYFARIWTEVTPTRILWWSSDRLDEPPNEWLAPASLVAPASDAAPPGRQPPAWRKEPTHWRATAERAVKAYPLRDLTVVDSNGFPFCFPAADISLDPRGFKLRIARGMPPTPSGAACLTFHEHNPAFTSQENRVFVGQISPVDGGALFQVDRLLADWSLAGNRVSAALDFLTKGPRLAPRLQAEAARRGQPVPKVRFPGEY